jgi:uncharacterized coiled-coil DUF342 family protein
MSDITIAELQAKLERVQAERDAYGQEREHYHERACEIADQRDAERARVARLREALKVISKGTGDHWSKNAALAALVDTDAGGES